MSSTKQYLATGGVQRILHSIRNGIALDALKLWNTDPTWAAASKDALDAYVQPDNSAYDTRNNRTINNYDVYAIEEVAPDNTPQWYFDSGAWFPFVADLQNYMKRSEIQAAISEAIASEVGEPISISELEAMLAEANFPAGA